MKQKFDYEAWAGSQGNKEEAEELSKRLQELTRQRERLDERILVVRSLLQCARNGIL